MSSILLSNPFVTPTPAPPPAGAEQQTALAVAPAQGASAGNQSGNSSGFSGNGSGFGSNNAMQLILAKARTATARQESTDAAPSSVVNAQTQGDSNSYFNTSLPRVEMPDPLPTSPFLKRL